jgi:hypothetical protein
LAKHLKGNIKDVLGDGACDPARTYAFLKKRIDAVIKPRRNSVLDTMSEVRK